MPNYRELRVWDMAMRLGTEVEAALTSIPPGYAELRDQLRRSVMSISTNIAEGCDRGSDKEFIRFLRIALSSAGEAESLTTYGANCSAIAPPAAREIELKLGLLRKMLRTLIAVIEPRTHRRSPSAVPSDSGPAPNAQ